MWQEYVVLAGSIVITLTLIPTVLDEDAHVPLSTSVPSVVVLLAQTWAFTSMGLLYTAAGTGLGLTLWSLIALQKGQESPLSLLDELASDTKRLSPVEK